MTDDVKAPDPQTFERELSARLDKLNEAIDHLEVKVELTEPEIAGRFREMVDDLREERAAIGSAVRAVGAAAGDAWKELAAGAERAYSRLEFEIEAAVADLEAELADDAAAYREAAARRKEAWQRALDELKLQAGLAKLEARDKIDELEDAWKAARPELERSAQDVGEALDTVKKATREAVDHLRRAVRATVDRLG